MRTIIESKTTAPKEYIGMATCRPKIKMQTPVPNGKYMTSDEFWKKAKVGFDEICKKHGVL
ncbi:MAG: hypothetical protein LBQ31_10125 [Bacteroidales bacterium]|nr:hypothetical protein [Bacteroidales bacterium]